MSRKQKLELTWIGKENRLRLEPGILLEDPEKSYHAKHRVSDGDIFDNRLIHGDNLLALRALERDLTGSKTAVGSPDPFLQSRSVFVLPPILQWCMRAKEGSAKSRRGPSF